MLALTRRRSPRVVIIGAGFGGLAAAVALRRRGIDDLMIIERADGVGGTWRQNIYPGAACDIQSHLYSFSFAPNRAWSRTYAYQPEILGLPGVGRRRLRPAPPPDARHARCAGMRWNDRRAHWDVELDRRQTPSSPTSSSAPSDCSAPRGIPTSTGSPTSPATLMHTAQWDATVDLTGKRVAVIGTGASGVQVVPELADIAAS